MPKTMNKRGTPRYLGVGLVILVACVFAAGVTVFLRHQSEKELLSHLERSQKDLRTLGGEIANIKDADLGSANDFISAYAQIEPLEKEYEVKLQEFSELYEQARERDGHRGWLDLERLRGEPSPGELGKDVRDHSPGAGDQRHHETRNLRRARDGPASRAGAPAFLA